MRRHQTRKRDATDQPISGVLFTKFKTTPATRNNGVVPKSDEKSLTEQQVYRRLDVHLCYSVRVAY